VAVSEAVQRAALANARLIFLEGGPQALAADRYTPASLRSLNAQTALMTISLYGKCSPRGPSDGIRDGYACVLKKINKINKLRLYQI
jgi:hypothetical protein